MIKTYASDCMAAGSGKLVSDELSARSQILTFSNKKFAD
jgi:hypothetical protein